MTERCARGALFLLLCLYVAYFSAYTSYWHMTLKSFAYDLGTVDQGVWLAGHSRDLFVTVRGLHLLGDHVRIISFVLAPLYWIWDDVRMLLIVQTVVIAAGAVFLSLLARRELGNRYFLILALCASYLLNPAVQNLNLDHVHPDAFASTFILASIYFVRTARYVPFWVSVALALICKEDVPFVYIGFGIVLIVRGQRRLGIALALVAATYFVACAEIILPYFNDVGLFRVEGQGYFTGVKKHMTDPIWLFQRLLSTQNLYYFLALGLPVGFLSLLTPRWLVPALPALAANLMTDVGYLHTVKYHYTTSIVPFLYVAAIESLRKLLQAAPASMRIEHVGAVAVVACSVVANLMFGELPLYKLDRLSTHMRAYRTDPGIRAVYKVLEQVPPDVSVSADYSLVPHLSHRQRIYMFPNPFRAQYWGIQNKNPHPVDTIDYVFVRSSIIKEQGKQVLDDIVQRAMFELVAGDQSVGLYRRINNVELSESASCADWNGDGKVTAVDARNIGAAITGKRDCPLYVCDVDGDGVLSMKDGLAVSQRTDDEKVELECPPRR